jgi:hypothetical protein
MFLSLETAMLDLGVFDSRTKHTLNGPRTCEYFFLLLLSSFLSIV